MDKVAVVAVVVVVVVLLLGVVQDLFRDHSVSLFQVLV
jgi:hypothetical protein